MNEINSPKGLRQFLTGTGLYAGSSFLIGLGKFFLAPIYARFLSPAQYGIVGTVNAVTGLVSIFLLMGLHAAVVREYYELKDDADNLQRYLKSILIFMAVLDGAIICVLFLAGPLTVKWMFHNDDLKFFPYIAIGLTSGCAASFLGVFLSLMQAKQHAHIYVAAQICRFVLLVGVTLVLLEFVRMKAIGVLLGDLVSTLAVSLGLAWLSFKPGSALSQVAETTSQPATLKTLLGPSFEKEKVRAALSYGAPLIPQDLAQWITAVSDRLIMARYQPIAEVGIYSLGCSLAMGMNMLVSAINSAYMPFYFNTIKNDPEARSMFSAIRERYAVGISFVCLCFILFAKEGLQLLVPRQYNDIFPITFVITIANMFLGLYLTVAPPLYYFKKTKRIAQIAIIAAASNIGLNLFIVPKYGAIGAAWTTLVAYGLMFLLANRDAGRLCPTDDRPFVLWGLPALAATAGLACNSMPLSARSGIIVVFTILCGLVLGGNNSGILPTAREWLLRNNLISQKQ